MIPVAFWTFRLMIGVGMLAAGVAAVLPLDAPAAAARRRPPPACSAALLPLIPLLPAAANTFGWIFTETARQPWLAFGISKVADGISPGLTRAEVLASLVGFTVVYGVLAVVWFRLVRHLSRQPLAPARPPDTAARRARPRLLRSVAMITFWFALVVLAWVLFFVLEGFDFGVGLLGPLLGRDDHERGAAVRTVGPFWDGNEVWLVAAIGVTFAAFPDWYAALLVRPLPADGRAAAAARRARGGPGVPRQGRRRTLAPPLRRGAGRRSSAGIVLLWGAVLAVFVHGLALGADGEVTGTGLSRSLAPLLTPAAGLGALAALLAAAAARRDVPRPAHHRPGPPPRPRAWRRRLGHRRRGRAGRRRHRHRLPARPGRRGARRSAPGLLARHGREALAFAGDGARRGRRGGGGLHRARRRWCCAARSTRRGR